MIELTGGERLRWPGPVVTECELEEGKKVNPRELKQTLEAGARKILPKRAREYLARYARTVEEYCQHFEQKGYPPETIRSLVPRLKEEGYLDDERVAREHIRKRIENKPRGKKMIIAELGKKGIARTQAKNLVEKEIDSGKERELARRYCKKNQGLSERKLASRLGNRGFPGSIIKEMLREYSAGEKM